MQSLRQDLLLGVRSLRKEPASAVITSLTLALGIGLCTISFSLLYGVFFRGLDVPEPNRLVIVSRTNPARDNRPMDVTVHDYYDWAAQQTSFESLAHFFTGREEDRAHLPRPGKLGRHLHREPRWHRAHQPHQRGQHR